MMKTNIAVDPASKHFKLKPWSHQIEGIERALQHDNYAWLYEVGTGKSKTAVETLRYVFSRHGEVLRTLIVCPPIVINNWLKEWKLSSNIPSDKVIPLLGSGKKRVEILRGSPANSIFVCNYETLSMKGFLDEVISNPFDVVLADEIHYCKNPDAKRSKSLYRIGDLAHYRYALTGTPILNNSMDIFGIWRFLDKGETFGRNKFGFMHKYFYDKNKGMPKQSYFPMWLPIKSKEIELSKEMAKLSHHVKKEDCLDLPPLHKISVEVPMSPEQAKAYKEMKKDMLTFLGSGDKAAIASLALTKGLRLLQITSGFVGAEKVDGEKIEHIFKKTPRAEALKDLLVKLTPNHKVIVWSVFTQNYQTIRDICEEIGVGYVEVNGGIGQRKKDEAVERFETDDSIRVFSGHPVSGGIGINLVSSPYSIYYSRNFSLGADIQSEARNYRGGSEIHENITRIDLVTPGTLDEAVLTKLKMKMKISASVLAGLKDEI